MFLSITEVFKIGIGPSSSHTTGPMIAAKLFATQLQDPAYQAIQNGKIKASLCGSLAFTGKGHHSDQSIILGLLGKDPEAIDPDRIPALLAEQNSHGFITLAGGQQFEFSPEDDLVFEYGPPLPGHSNGMLFQMYAGQDLQLEEIYYSTGGGFVVTSRELDRPRVRSKKHIPFPFASADEMLLMGQEAGESISDMKRANEQARARDLDLDQKLAEIWQAMMTCMERGLSQKGELSGGLGIKRRAADIYVRLQAEQKANRCLPHGAMDYLSVYALAVNEENAAGGRVVTAPTNGAAGVIPAVLRYYLEFYSGAKQEDAGDFLLTAAAIGGLIKHNASISGAEVGCQGEVGSAAAMAAAGLCAVLGGTNAMIESAAEIALEHHLGMTCDPIGGLVQVPCIERNALGAVKAVTAAALALKGDGTHFVSLDQCIETMRQTGLDMNEKYKETSQGGLAVNTVEC